MKIIVIIGLIAVITALVTAGVFLNRDRGRGNRVVIALGIRVLLSMMLVVGSIENVAETSVQTANIASGSAQLGAPGRRCSIASEHVHAIVVVLDREPHDRPRTSHAVVVEPRTGRPRGSALDARHRRHPGLGPRLRQRGRA